MAPAIRFYGLGKLGLPLAALFASGGAVVAGIDIDPRHINRLKAGVIPFDEPGLSDLLKLAGNRLTFQTAESQSLADISIVHVPTPSNRNSPGFSSAIVEQAVETACKTAAAGARSGDTHLIVVASTLMPGSLEKRIVPLLRTHERPDLRFQLSYVPDFVAIGNVIRGFQKPSFLIVGADDEDAAARTKELYQFILDRDVPVVEMSLSEAELAKVAWNSFLCLKIDYANMIARLADAAGGMNADRILRCLSQDPTMGRKFLKPGMPFGGPCLSRDADALVALCAELDCDSSLARGIRDANGEQIDFLVDQLLRRKPERVAVLGLGFKAGSDITQASPSFMIIGKLLERGVRVSAYDPAKTARESVLGEPWGSSIELSDSMEAACARAQTILVAVDDPRYSSVGSTAASGVTIVDPWGCVEGTHPGLVRPGRNS